MADSAEAIARVCADLKAGRVQDIFKIGYLSESVMELFKVAEVVDATRIYSDLVAREKGIDVYAEHVLCPVWGTALIGYLNEHGNVTVMHIAVVDLNLEKAEQVWKAEHQWESSAGTHTIDWNHVRWVYTITVWLGGRGGDGPMPTSGPLHTWTVAVYPDGEIADIRWIQLDPRGEDHMGQWDMASLVWLGAVNLGNCVNVELREPVRQRAAARRIARTGVRVNEIHVRPISKSYRGAAGATTSSVPLHTVRGHFAKYGPKYDRALLFGKYEGRYWIPQHARGVEEAGRVEHTYVMD